MGLNQILDHAMEIVLEFDDKGNIFYANEKAEKSLEYDQGLQNVNITDIFPSLFCSEEDKLCWKVSLNQELKDVVAYRGNRTCFNIEAKFEEYDAEAKTYICFMIDASVQTYLAKMANQADVKVESAEQVKTQFVANVTHELRTPVNGILGNTQELLTRNLDDDVMNKLRLIERGCKDMHSIINNILDFSKLEAGKFDLEHRKFNFREMMEYVRSVHINKIIEKGLQLFMTISPEVPEFIVGDELRIEQVLNNLLSNATKFTSAGRITVEVVKTAQIQNRIELFIMVIDTGIGIAQANLDKLFKSFSQVEASTTRKYGGTGLGLNISKQIVELMNGSIHVESELNRGTMFSFHIWVDVANENGEDASDTVQTYDVKVPTLQEISGINELYQYGSAENKQELSRKMNKLILSVEMDNWEKAEMFMESIKQLTAEGPSTVKSAVLRLKMAVQKADYEKTAAAYEVLQGAVGETMQ